MVAQLNSYSGRFVSQLKRRGPPDHEDLMAQLGLTTKVRAEHEGRIVTRFTNLKRLHNFEIMAH